MTFLPKLAIALALLVGPTAWGAGGDQKTTLGPAASIGPPDRKAALGPDTIPGFFDETTGRFTPLTAEPSAFGPSAAGTTVSGTFGVVFDFDFDSDLTLSTIFCQVTLEFGNLVNGQFFPNHTAQSGVNFSANHPDAEIDVPYSYTPNSNNAKLRLKVTCSAEGNSGVEHTKTVYYSFEDLPHGDVSRDVHDFDF
jgi:hypothetical protein